ncbi:hypothetical protein CYY_004730 [Polysphondylium violaceum]|uniref:Uncharacterized protein n=1 Tax=Polysphondylium violaceum TaxID=133409 RepID=A0A8J4PU49_9MYCE|nr:hypothetical protein CYY_004730 [Polysphondylium violaceum]
MKSSASSTTTTTTTTKQEVNSNSSSNVGLKNKNNNLSHLVSTKRLPIDISHDTLMDPVNIPSKFKLFQASSDNTGNIFGYIQYNLLDGVRVSARTLDSRLKVTVERPPSSVVSTSIANNNISNTPIKFSFSWYETPRGPREADIGINVSNLYSIYKKHLGSVFQVGCSAGIRVHSLSRMIVSPFINPKFTYFGKFGWINLNVPINKRSNRVVLKHHMFFSIAGNTLLSSLEVTSRLGDMSKYLSGGKESKDRLAANAYPCSNFDRNRITCGSRFFETIHYKIVHVNSSTEAGVRRVSKLYGVSWQLEFGLKHSLGGIGALQCLFTHTLGQKTNFGLSFGFDI